jgi:hypothetical protein
MKKNDIACANMTSTPPRGDDGRRWLLIID